MSGADRERRRRRRQRACTASSNDEINQQRYTQLLLNRLREWKLIEEPGEPVVAMQKRRVHNWQHAIPFRQQFIEQLMRDCQYLDRRITADRQRQDANNRAERAALQRQLEKMDKSCARTLTELEATYGEKERELELYNNRRFVREVLEDHLKKSTPTAQARRVLQLEENYSKLKREHDELVRGVNQNVHQYDKDKHRHDADMEEITAQLKQCQMTANSLVENRERADERPPCGKLVENQQSTPLDSTQDAVLQKHTIARLTAQVEHLQNARRLDLQRSEQLEAQLDQMREMTNQLQTLLTQRNTDKKGQLQHNKQADNSLVRQGDTSEDFDATHRALTTLQDVPNQTVQDLVAVQQCLPTTDHGSQQRSLRIHQTNAQTVDTKAQFDRMRSHLDNPAANRASSKHKRRSVESIPDATIGLPSASNISRLDQLSHEQNRLKTQMADRARKQSPLAALTADVNAVKQQLAALHRAGVRRNAPVSSDALKALVEDAKKEILDSVGKLLKHSNAPNRAPTAKASNAQAERDASHRTRSTLPMLKENDAPAQPKRILYLESLSPHDLLHDIWKQSSQPH